MYIPGFEMLARLLLVSRPDRTFHQGRAQGSKPLAPISANRNGGWMSLANTREQRRMALPEDLDWVTPIASGEQLRR